MRFHYCLHTALEDGCLCSLKKARQLTWYQEQSVRIQNEEYLYLKLFAFLPQMYHRRICAGGEDAAGSLSSYSWGHPKA